MLEYLDPSTVQGARQSTPPVSGQTRTGYGSRLPSTWELRIANRWHRVRVMCWSNSGTAYVMVGGRRLLLGSYEPTLAVAHERPIGPLCEYWVVHEGEPSWHQRRAGHISAASTMFRSIGDAHDLVAGYAKHQPNIRVFVRREYHM